MVKWIDEIGKFAASSLLVIEKLDKFVDAETIKDRKSKCTKCPYNVEEKCTICSCYIEIKTAAKVNRKLDGTKEITHCPKYFWEDSKLLLSKN